MKIFARSACRVCPVSGEAHWLGLEALGKSEPIGDSLIKATKGIEVLCGVFFILARRMWLLVITLVTTVLFVRVVVWIEERMLLKTAAELNKTQSVNNQHM